MNIVTLCSVPVHLADRVEKTIGEDIAVRDDRRAVNKKRRKKIDKNRAHDRVQQKQYDKASDVIKKEEFEAVRLRIREQYKERKVC